MKIRIVALCLLFVTSLGLAQESPKPAAKAVAAERAAMLEGLRRGKPIKGSHEQYRHVPEVFAVERRGSAETPQQAISRVGASGRQVLELRGDFVLFRATQQEPAFVERVAGSAMYPTVVNDRTGTFGVLTGTLVVKPKSMAESSAIASRYGLEITKEYAQLRTVLFRVKSGMDVADVTAALQADPRIESAYPEIIEHVHMPK